MIYMLCGFAGGVLGGMGMGGGTALIPLLTIFCGVEQSAAQGINLLAFLPMAAIALSIHAKNGLLSKEGLVPLIVPALVFSVLGSLLAAYLPAEALKKGFGVFLVLLSFLQLKSAIARRKTEKNGGS
ncbi:MAG: sulfite exporter TauE/SafE family protein [Clostridia bacterium]|nr:sulfite exporter TauE/SafE family protein [Clostridia bacterium]